MTRHARRFHRAILVALLLVSALAVTACATEPDQGDTSQTGSDAPADSTDDSGEDTADEPGSDSDASMPAWAETELTDVQTGETFTIAEQGDGPVLVQAFAVW